jgi:hypothetical protein
MGEIRTYMDGRRFLRDSPFRSWQFRSASMVGFVAVCADVYLIVRYWQRLSINAAECLVVLIGIQVVYQWWRTIRYYRKLRELYSLKPGAEAPAGSPVDLALRITAGALTEALFYFNGTALAALIFIGVLMSRLFGGK